MLHDAVVHEELGILRPAIGALGELDLVVAQGSPWAAAVSILCGEPYPMWLSRMISVRPALGLPEGRERVLYALEIVGVAHVQHVPAIGAEAGGDISVKVMLVLPSMVM